MRAEISKDGVVILFPSTQTEEYACEKLINEERNIIVSYSSGEMPVQTYQSLMSGEKENQRGSA